MENSKEIGQYLLYFRNSFWLSSANRILSQYVRLPVKLERKRDILSQKPVPIDHDRHIAYLIHRSDFKM